MTPHATAARSLLVLGCLLVASCARVGDPAAVEPVAATAPVAGVEPPASEIAALPEPAAPPAREEVAAARPDTLVAEPVAAAEAPQSEVSEVAVPPSSFVGNTPEPAAPPATATTEPSAMQASAETLDLETPASVSRPSAEALDFRSLVSRLRKTKAINLSTKLSVKNLSDDLLADFRAYHTRRGTVSLGDLRRSYDSLFQRLHSLLHDADPLLDRDIDRSRAALWEVLADPRKFSAANLMTGA